jgi:hypothetical protein
MLNYQILISGTARKTAATKVCDLRRFVQERSTMNALDRDIHRSAEQVYSTSRPGFSCAGGSGTISAGASPSLEGPLHHLPKPPMDESTRWGLSRYATLLVVLTAHTALVAWLVTALRTGDPLASSSESVQLLLIAPKIVPKIRVAQFRPRRIDSGSPLPAAPPTLDVPSSPSDSEPKSGSSGSNGSNVDWGAEARRALQAFEIRSREPAANNSVSRNSPAEQPWWPAHRPGDRFKTADGNWIVWINSSCYQVATSSTSHGAVLPGTICPGKSGTPGTDRTDSAH